MPFHNPGIESSIEMWVFLLPKTDQLFDRRQISWAKKEKNKNKEYKLTK